MEPSIQVFWQPKHGNAVEEYEDASAYSTHRFAVADGATESSFAERWAQNLVKQFVAAPPKHIREENVPLEEWLKPQQKEWHKSIPWERLPWYAEEKARSGAFATFLGVEITPAPAKFRFLDLFRPKQGIRWHALAVGDSCFFQIRNDAITKSFPFSRAEEFNSRPLLISSNPARNQSVWKQIKTAEGDVKPGDMLLLMTDAIAHWFLKEQEAGHKPWETVSNLATEKDFSEFVTALRQTGALKNDDTTLLRCHWKDK